MPTSSTPESPMQLYAIQWFNIATGEQGVYKLHGTSEDDARRQFNALYGQIMRVQAVSLDCEE
jgi:hypothetical protein